jgi:hypothetical protein
MAAVNACFVPDEGVAVATNGGARHQRTLGSTTDAEAAQKSGGSWSGNGTFIHTDETHRARQWVQC